MQFRYTDEERELLGFAGEAFRGQLPLSRLREAGAPIDAWVTLGRDGWSHASVGPDPLPLATLAGLARVAGTVAAGEEFVANAWLIPQLCDGIADDDGARQWLATHLERPGYVASLGSLAPRANGSSIVLGAHQAFDRYEVDAAATGVSRTRAGGTTVSPVADLSRSAATVDVDRDDVEHQPLALDTSRRELLGAGLMVLRCAALLGTAGELLKRTVAHVEQREQFGQPLGQFQAVKHLCADVHTAVEVGWLAALYAAVSWADDEVALADARTLTVAAALDAARVAAQLHGGMGFTWESDLHWLLKSTLDGQLAMPDPHAVAIEVGMRLVASE